MRRVGDHAMTSSERQRRYLTKLAAQAQSLAPETANPALAEALAKNDRLRRRLAAAEAADSPTIKYEDIRRWPKETARGLCRRLDRDVAIAFHNAFGQALSDRCA